MRGVTMIKKFKTIDNEDVAFRRLMKAEYPDVFLEAGQHVEEKSYKLSLSEYVKYSKYLEEYFANYSDAARDVKRKREEISRLVSFGKKLHNGVVQSGLIEIHCE